MKKGFLHIPKTGGSSFVIHLASQAADSVRRVGIFEFMNFIDSMSDDTIITGHIPAFVMRQHSADRHLYTILRDPIRRAISTYRFILSLPSHRMHRHIAARKLSLADCFDHPILRHELGNLQTKMLGWTREGTWRLPALDIATRLEFEKDYVRYLLEDPSTDTLEQAKNVLNNEIRFATLEMPDTICALFREICGARIDSLPVFNVTPPVEYELRDEDLLAIHENTQLDQRLYQYGLSLLRSSGSAASECWHG
jgi:hypothetical protein